MLWLRLFFYSQKKRPAYLRVLLILLPILHTLARPATDGTGGGNRHNANVDAVHNIFVILSLSLCLLYMSKYDAINRNKAIDLLCQHPK